jgi:hypothetical protein
MPFIYKLYAFLFLAKSLTCSCTPEKRKDGFEKAKSVYDVQKIGELPKVVNESSGLAKDANGVFWTHNDSGGAAELYGVDSTGQLVDKQVVNAKNVDWEDLSIDRDGAFFIADVGNNSQSRTDLCVYKFSKPNVERIAFKYAEQTAFPPEKEKANFDCEAMFWFNGKVYLFTKSQPKSDKETRLYELPDRGGEYTVSVKDKIFLKTPVTGAAVNPQGTEFALMTYGKLFIFGIEKKEINFKKPIYCLKTSHKQTEAITYVNEHDLLMTNEQRDVFLIKKK